MAGDQSDGAPRAALVTGASGFVGREVRGVLAKRGWTTVGISRADGDIRDRHFVAAVLAGNRFDLIVHLAGVVRGDEDLLASSNVHGTEVLLEAIPSTFPGSVVLASSSAVYGASGSTPIDESAPTAPVTPYGRSKLAQEHAALERARRQGLRLVVARLFNLLGPGLSASFACGAFVERIVAVERGADPVMRVGNLSTSRDYVDVRDAAAALIDVGIAGDPGSVYNVASGTATPTDWCLQQLLSMSSATIRIEVDPRLMAPADVPTQVGDAHRLAARTGWRPTITVDTSLADMLSVRRMEAT